MGEGESRTRKELDKALRELLKRKPLAQIRVRELMELCGLRRQSFYYHFKDVYDLFDWSVGREREAVRKRREECLTWEQALRDLLDRLAEERPYYQAVLESRGRAGLREALALEETLEQAFTYYRSRCGLPPDPKAAAPGIQCAEAVLLSLLENWLTGVLALPPEALTDTIQKLVDQSVAGAVVQTLGRDFWSPTFS